MSMEIRPAALEDFDSIFPLLQQLWPALPLDREALRGTLAKALEAGDEYALCYLLQGEIVGFAAGSLINDFFYAGTVCQVSTLVVDEKIRRQKIGNRLLDTVVTLARENQCRAVELDSGLHRLWAHEFYERYGFEKNAFHFAYVL